MPLVTRVAAIDCGTNSIRLLVADVDATAGTLVDLDRRMEVVRLGQGVDRTGRIAPEAMARTLDAARRYAAVCADLGHFIAWVLYRTGFPEWVLYAALSILEKYAARDPQPHRPDPST